MLVRVQSAMPKRKFTMGEYVYKALKIDGKRIDEHRRVAELAFGKEMVKGMVVHHKNGDKKDNRIENLELMTLSEHSRMHMTGHDTSAETRSKIGNSKKRYFLKNGSRRNEPVVRISLDGKDVKIYNTMWDVYNDGFRASHVKEVCEHRPKRKTHGGFKWLFLSEYNSFLETCDNGIRAAC